MPQQIKEQTTMVKKKKMILRVTASHPKEGATIQYDCNLDKDCVRVHPEGLYDRHDIPVYYNVPKRLWDDFLNTVWGANDVLHIENRQD